MRDTDAPGRRSIHLPVDLPGRMANHLEQMSHRTSSLLLTMFVGLLSPSCGQRQPEGPESTSRPQRIVSLVPAVTEMLFAIDAGDRVVGVSDFDSFPPEVASLPKVGALLDPSLEAILGLRPDLVITYRSQSALADRLGSVGIDTFPFASGSIDDMLTTIERLGAATGNPEAGVRLATDISERLATIREETGPDRPGVLLVHSRDPGVVGTLYTEGGPSYLNEIIEIAGGNNLFSDVDLTSFQPSLEEILNRSPEVIIELVPSDAGSAESLGRRLGDWQRLNTLPAVRNRRVHILADDYLLVVGPRLPLVAERFREAIRP